MSDDIALHLAARNGFLEVARLLLESETGRFLQPRTPPWQRTHEHLWFRANAFPRKITPRHHLHRRRTSPPFS